jgi:hypothetical protein
VRRRNTDLHARVNDDLTLDFGEVNLTSYQRKQNWTNRSKYQQRSESEQVVEPLRLARYAELVAHHL